MKLTLTYDAPDEPIDDPMDLVEFFDRQGEDLFITDPQFDGYEIQSSRS